MNITVDDLRISQASRHGRVDGGGGGAGSGMNLAAGDDAGAGAYDPGLGEVLDLTIIGHAVIVRDRDALRGAQRIAVDDEIDDLGADAAGGKRRQAGIGGKLDSDFAAVAARAAVADELHERRGRATGATGQGD